MDTDNKEILVQPEDDAEASALPEDNADQSAEVEGNVQIPVQEEKDEDNIKVSIQLETNDMYSFLLLHNYKSIPGVFGVCISIFAFVYLIVNFNSMDWMMKAILVVLAVLFTVVNPIMLYNKAKGQVKKNKTLMKPIIYEFAGKYLKLSQDKEVAEIPWDQIMCAKKMKKNLVIYITNVRAFVLPISQLGSQYALIVEHMREKMSAKRVKIKEV